MKLALSLVYRPPAQTVQTDNDLYEQISEVSDAHDAVIMGDFNLPTEKWGKPLTSHHGHDLYNNIKESSLTQFVEKPTRGNHVLDLVLATKENLIENLNVGEVFSNSDHRGITFHIKFTADEMNINNEKIPDYRRANFCKLKSLLNQIDWSFIQTPTYINTQWKFFSD